jgi:hypothetical protein
MMIAAGIRNENLGLFLFALKKAEASKEGEPSA